MKNKPDYGVDAPGVLRNLAVLGSVSLLCGLFLAQYIPFGSPGAWKRTFLFLGFVLLAESLLMMLYSQAGKFRHRDRMLSCVEWRGDEAVLDVGTGRGLLLIGAAKQLRSGKAFGIDIWNKEDLSGNAREATLRNAELEGVQEKVEVLNQNATRMEFSDNSFDVVLSNLCLHNIPTPEGRAAACREIARVLKPGGTALISDYKNTTTYARIFGEAGLSVKTMGPYVLDTFPPLRVLRLEKSVVRQVVKSYKPAHAAT